MKQRIVAFIARPDFWPHFWLVCLLLWTLCSAGRSLETPWARAACSEALRWGAGIGLALALSAALRQTALAGRCAVALTGALALLGLWGGLNPASGGLVGPYHDHQLYGSALLILLPFTAAIALTARDLAWRLGASAAGAAGMVCLLLSETRSSWAGLLVAALVFGGLWVSRPANRPRRWRVALVPAAALLAAILGFWLLAGPADMNAALGTRAATLARLSQDASWQDRLQVWHGAGRLTQAHPLAGIGLGRYPGAQWAWTHAGRRLEPSARPSLSEEAHCFYLQTAAETGAVGLGLYLAALAAFAAFGLRRLRRNHRRPLSSQEALVMAALSALAGQSIDALASPSWQFSETSFFFWAVLGLGLAAARRESPEAAPAAASSPLRRVGRLALSGGVAIALAAQILPLGLLLTPVEAYSAPAGWTLSSISLTLISPSGPISVGNRLQFQLIANYNDKTGGISTQNITADAATVYNALVVNGVGNSTYMTSAFVKGAVTVQSLKQNINGTLSVTAIYYDSKGVKYSNTIVIPVQP